MLKKQRTICLLLVAHFVIGANITFGQVKYSLRQALIKARENNLDLKTQQYNIGIAQSDITSAKMISNLVLNNQTLQEVKPSYFAPNSKWYSGKNQQVWWQLTKSFQLSPQRKYKIDLANKNVTLAEKGYAGSEREVLSTVSAKWLEAWTTQKQLDIIQTAMNNVDSLVNINQLRFRNQVITQTDLLRTELLQKQYAIQLATVKQQLINKQNELKQLLNIQDEVAIDTADGFLFLIPESVDSLLNESIQNRFDVQIAKAQIDLNASNIKLQKSLAVPQPELGVIWNPQNMIPYLGIYATIELPFFNRNQGEIKKAMLLKQQAQQDLTALQSKISTEVKTAFSSYKLQQQNIQNFGAVLNQSQSILDNVKYSYLRGGTTIVDFLEAQRSWLDTQQQYYASLQAYRESYVQLLLVSNLINQFIQ